MIRTLIYGLTILHLGPGLAFAVLAFGCDPAQPLLGELCRRDTLGMFLSLTIIFWVVLTAASLVLAWRRSSSTRAAGTTPS